MSIFHPVPGDIVFLVTECRSERSGQVYEIGTAARVVGARSGVLALEIEDPAGRDMVVCARDGVAHERKPRLRQATPWYRRRTAVGT